MPADLSETKKLKKDLFVEEALAYVPHLLELVDKNRLSQTYGCFDRAYWHYRTSDFPSGMFQESVLPLALAFKLDHPDNPYFGKNLLKDLVIAGIDYAEKSSHKDGSCDDYFPYERASGATAFSLYAITESILELDLTEDEYNRDFLELRGRYLAGYGYQESGVLSNHKALIVLALYNVYLVTKILYFKESAERLLKNLLALQTEEGWFPEYEGADPGYLTFTIDFLAKYYQKSGDESVLEPLEKATNFALYFLHPDGSFGGEYGSRNTFHFMPHGFVALSNRFESAKQLAASFLESLESKTRSRIDDDRIFIHYVYNYIQAYRNFEGNVETPQTTLPTCEKLFKEAGLWVKRTDNRYAVINLHKGGVAKIFVDGELKISDAAIVGRNSEGKIFTSQASGSSSYEETEEEIVVHTECSFHSELLFKPFMFWCFRSFLIFFARFMPANFTRKILQKKAITKKRIPAPMKIKKTFKKNDLNHIEYEFEVSDPKFKIKELWVASDATFIYIATSQPFQKGSFLSWVHLPEVVGEVNSTQKSRYVLKAS